MKSLGKEKDMLYGKSEITKVVLNKTFSNQRLMSETKSWSSYTHELMLNAVHTMECPFSQNNFYNTSVWLYAGDIWARKGVLPCNGGI